MYKNQIMLFVCEQVKLSTIITSDEVQRLTYYNMINGTKFKSRTM